MTAIVLITVTLALLALYVGLMARARAMLVEGADDQAAAIWNGIAVSALAIAIGLMISMFIRGASA